ncbi:hypothetical protein [Vibrio harveyi]|uniref:hypothetical protein n=1 Tax=Vibrio harveyi TaxID=669 RepID=UPI0004265EA7|nr:hypothetical protein [Vibrio harveyi]
MTDLATTCCEALRKFHKNMELSDEDFQCITRICNQQGTSTGQKIEDAPSSLSVEIDLSGDNLPEWLNPLDFAGNLNSAIIALDSVETLSNAHRALRNSYIALLTSLDDQQLTMYKTEIEKRYDEQTHEIDVQLKKKIVMLASYSKAAKLGFKYQLDIDALADVNDGNESTNDLAIIRDGLQNLRDQYRKIEARLRPTVIPVSLRFAAKKDPQPQYLLGSDILPIETENRNKIDTTAEAFGLHSFEVDLTELEQFKSLHSNWLWIRQIGIEIHEIGLTQSTIPNYITAIIEKAGAPDLYSGASEYRCDKIAFNDIYSTPKEPSVSWSRNTSVIGIDPRTTWKVGIKKNSMRVAETKILDVILYFNVITMEA